MNLRIADCCGACVHVDVPKKPEDHAPHYSVAKTERWCFKHGVPVTRESVCDDFTLETKKGAVLAFKRILAFNRKLTQIISIKDWMEQNQVEELVYYNNCGGRKIPNMVFTIRDGKIAGRFCSSNWGSWSTVSCKQAGDYKRLLEAYKEEKALRNMP